MNTLMDGLALLAIGMGFVLSFLVLLIFGMGFMSKIVLWLNKLYPEAIEEVKTTTKKVAAAEEAIAVAIAAIMAQRRQ